MEKGMKFTLDTAKIYVPDGVPVEDALSRTTHLAVGAHQDDLEIMALDGILKCFQQPDLWFTGVVATNGSGSPRDGMYRDYTDKMMQDVRRKEQKKAAHIGEYGALAILDYASSVVKDSTNSEPVSDLKALFEKARPQVVYTHNLADKHDTHVATTLRTIAALRSLPSEARPQHVYGCEAWRDLDWLSDADKVVFDVSSHEELQAALLAVFESQICGGKRYDLATLGRRRANATYFASHGTDKATSLIYAMDLTPLVLDTDLDIADFVQFHIRAFATEVGEKLAKFE
jgi:LmbE family N-acetylglucosaminyl deacetylase